MQEINQFQPGSALPKGAPYNPTTAVFYGQFVEAVYTMYGNDPSNLTPKPSADFPKGYRLAAWIQMRDFIFESTGLTFYGIIAQSQAEPNQFILAIRGTSTWVEWWDDLTSIRLVPFKNFGSAGFGFLKIYETLEVVANPSGALTELAAPQSLKSVGGFSQQVAALVKQKHRAAARRSGRAGDLACRHRPQPRRSARHTLCAGQCELRSDPHSDRLHIRVSACGRLGVRKRVQCLGSDLVADRQST